MMMMMMRIRTKEMEGGTFGAVVRMASSLGSFEISNVSSSIVSKILCLWSPPIAGAMAMDA